MGRKLLVAVDDSATSQGAALWALLNLARTTDEVHLISVAPPVNFSMTPSAPIASAGAVAALSLNLEQQRKQIEEQCRHVLHQVVHKVPEGRRQELDIHRHVLPAAGGASGLAESVVAFAKQRGVDLVVVGSRGMGAVKSTLMSLVGLGSVSGYLVHHLHCPVAVCRGREEDATSQEVHKVMVSLDDSEASKQALEWVVDNALGPNDELHLVCVALPIPYPVSAFTDNHLPQPDVEGWRRRQRATLRQAEAVAHRSLRGVLAARAPQVPPSAAGVPGAAAAAAAAAEPPPAHVDDAQQVSPGEDFTSPPMPAEEWAATYRQSMQRAEAVAGAAAELALGLSLQIVAEDAAASEVLEADEFDAATQDSIHYAREVVTKAVDNAAVKVDKSRIFFKALAPEGGASDVGQSIVHYAKDNGMGMVVMGARGMGSWKRAIMSFVGLGSVSDYVVHNCDAPVVIIKQH